MKISSINTNCNLLGYGKVSKNSFTKAQNTNFKGIVIVQSRETYEGDNGPSTSPFQIYDSYIDHTIYCTYHPFKRESSKKINESIKAYNYSSGSDCGGVYYTEIQETKLGSRLPYTKQEWENLSDKEKSAVIEKYTLPKNKNE